MFFYKVDPESNYGKDAKQYWLDVEKWANVIRRVAELLDDPITKVARDAKKLFVDRDELTRDNKKLFTIDGRLKENSKKALEIKDAYLAIIQEEGLTDWKDIQIVNFTYGVMRTSTSQKLSMFFDTEGRFYIKANYNLTLDESEKLQSIDEVEYEEIRLDTIKKRKESEVQ